MKKIFFFQLLLLCLQADAQKPKNTTPPKLPVKKELPGEVTENTSGFISPIVSIPYKGLVTAPTPAQAKDNLLWYKGKKVNDSIIITTDAKLVLYSKNRNIVVVQSDAKKDPWLKTIQRMEAIKQDKKKLVDATAGKPNSFFLYPHISATFKEYDDQNKEYAEVLKNVIPLPQAVSTATFQKFSTGGVASLRRLYFAGVPASIKQAFDEVMGKKKNYPSLDFPAPPQEDFSICYQYDGIAKNQQYINNYKWEQEFTKYEKDLVNRSLSIFKTIEQLKLNADPEAIQIKTELDKVIEFAFARMKNKVELLVKNYGKDFTRLPAIVRMAIAIERQKQLMGTSEESNGKLMQQVISLLDGSDKYIEEQMTARNYDVVFNIAFLIGIERQKQLLGGEEKNTIPAIMEKFKAFNRFKMQMEVDFAYSCDNDDGTCPYHSVAGTLATKKDFYVSLIPYKYGSFQIFLTNTIYKPEEEAINRELDQETPDVAKYDLELTALSGYKKTIVADDNGNSKIITEPYTGAEILSHLPAARIYFCPEKQDTLYLLGFYPKGGGTSSKAYWMHYEMNHLLANISEDELNAHMPQIVGDAESYKKRMKAYEIDPTGFDKLDKEQNQYTIVETYQKMTENIAKYAMTKDAAVLFEAENGNPEIMNTKADVSGKQIEKVKINKGTIEIKIVHDPLPYKTALKK